MSCTVDDVINIDPKWLIGKNKKAIVQGEDGNIFLSEHDGKGWVCTAGKRINYFAEGYIVEYEYL